MTSVEIKSNIRSKTKNQNIKNRKYNYTSQHIINKRRLLNLYIE